MAKNAAKALSPFLQAQFGEWSSEQKPKPIDKKLVVSAIREDLKFVRSMSSKEFTFWQKWDEMQHDFGGISKSKLHQINAVRKRIWRLNHPDDYLLIEPELVFAKHVLPITSVSIWGHERLDFYSNPDLLAFHWETLRVFVSTMPASGEIGRSLRFLVRDRRSKKYLGVICLSNDFFDLGGRDKAIGWTSSQKVGDGMINHTAIGSTIVPTQPFGFDFVGGKLLSLLCLSSDIAEMWEEFYGYRLAGVTTTSLYGDAKAASQYDRLKYWKRCGSTTGTVPIKLSKRTQKMIKDWMRYEHPFEYWKLHVASRESGLPLVRSYNIRSLEFCYRQLGFKPTEYQTNQTRRIYFARLYKNTDDFLCRRVEVSDLVPSFDNSTEQLSRLWKERYAKKRIESLKKKDRVSDASLFYSDLIGLSWDQAKARFPEKVAP